MFRAAMKGHSVGLVSWEGAGPTVVVSRFRFKMWSDLRPIRPVGSDSLDQWFSPGGARVPVAVQGGGCAIVIHPRPTIDGRGARNHIANPRASRTPPPSTIVRTPRQQSRAPPPPRQQSRGGGAPNCNEPVFGGPACKRLRTPALDYRLDWHLSLFSRHLKM